jgi:hypothetical protein
LGARDEARVGFLAAVVFLVAVRVRVAVAGTVSPGSRCT